MRWTMLALLALHLLGMSAAAAYFGFGGVQEQRTVLIFKADGSSIITNDTTMLRNSAEQAVKQWMLMQKQREGEEDEKADVQPTPPTSEKPYSDEELTQALRKMAETQAEEANDESGGKFDLLHVSSNTVRAVTSRAFSSLQELLQNPYQLWAQSGFMFQSVRLEKDTNSHLQITLAPYPNMARQATPTRQWWRSARLKSELKLILPGKILASSLPVVRDNTTAIFIDGEKEESAAAALKLQETNVVITAELGGLNLPEPLDSRTISRLAQQGFSSTKDEVPVTQGGPGYFVEALGMTTLTAYRFPEGEKLFKNNPALFPAQPLGTTLRAKIYAPRGRTIRTVSGAKLLSALDDRGRPISVKQDGLSPDEVVNFVASGGRDLASTQIQFTLGLPQPDAQSIEKVTGQALVTTVSQWKSLHVTNIVTQVNKEVDLAPLVPGAKLVITKAKVQNQQINILVQLTGPPAIRHLDVQAHNPAAQSFNSWGNDQKIFVNKGEKSSRTVNISAHAYSRNNAPPELEPVQLRVRWPEDLQRERVEFTLTGLDLL